MSTPVTFELSFPQVAVMIADDPNYTYVCKEGDLIIVTDEHLLNAEVYADYMENYCHKGVPVNREYIEFLGPL